MPFLPEPETLSGFRTVDGQIFSDIQSARKHQNRLTFVQFVQAETSVMEAGAIIDFIDRHAERIQEYYYVYADGADPAYMDET